MELKEIDPKLVYHDSIIWCYKTNCKYCYSSGAQDKEGDFGLCIKEEVIIDSEGRCKDE
jgi:hypothetical protein